MLRPRASEHEDGVMTSDPGWGFTEAWLLLSIGDHGRQGCTLSTMLGSADARNHDIPIEDAAARALGRLEASGLITSTGGSFSVTKLGRQIRKQRSGASLRRPPAFCLSWPRFRVGMANIVSSQASSGPRMRLTRDG